MTSPTTGAFTANLALGSRASATGSEDKENAAHVCEMNLTWSFSDYDIPVASLNLVHKCQADITLVSAEWVPSVAQGAQASNYVILTLAKGTIGSSVTALDALTSEAAFVSGTARAFTIVESTDTLTAGQRLFLNVSHNGTTAGVISGTLSVTYRLTN